MTTKKTSAEIRQTLESKMSFTDKVLDKVTPDKKADINVDILPNLTDEQRKELIEIENNAVRGFVGQLTELESAMGMLLMGHHFGWKVLYLIHSKKTIRKYEDILGVKIRELFPETGPSSYRSVGLELAIKASNFWKVVSGEHKIDKNFKEIDK